MNFYLFLIKYKPKCKGSGKRGIPRYRSKIKKTHGENLKLVIHEKDIKRVLIIKKGEHRPDGNHFARDLFMTLLLITEVGTVTIFIVYLSV